MKSQAHKKCAGFTLVELMIAMLVTLILLYAAVMAFRDASQSNTVVSQASDMTDNLRSGLNLIRQDLQQAGSGIPTGGIPIPYTSNGSSTAPCGTTAAPNRPMLNGVTTFPSCAWTSFLAAASSGFRTIASLTASCRVRRAGISASCAWM